MNRISLLLFVFYVLCFYSFASDESRVNVSIVTDEADAVISILEKRTKGIEVTEADWQRLFTSEGYVRLKKRELSLGRAFDEKQFRDFVLSNELATRLRSLKQTLEERKKLNIQRAGKLSLAYLPKSATIRAKIYPVIKPRDNSFVFEVDTNPATFLYLDPTESLEKFENTVAHELHHIGFGSSCPDSATKAFMKKLPGNTQKAVKWIGAFGEGFAMLAAAGGPDIHPHHASRPEDRARWDKDMLGFNSDLNKVENFLLDLTTGKLDDIKEIETARSFYGIQGP